MKTLITALFMLFSVTAIADQLITGFICSDDISSVVSVPFNWNDEAMVYSLDFLLEHPRKRPDCSKLKISIIERRKEKDIVYGKIDLVYVKIDDGGAVFYIFENKIVGFIE